MKFPFKRKEKVDTPKPKRVSKQELNPVEAMKKRNLEYLERIKSARRY